MRKGDKLVIIWATVILIFVFISLGFMIGMAYTSQMTTYYWMNIISVSAFSIVGILTLIPLHKCFRVIGSALMLGNCVIALGKFFFLTYRIYHLLLLALFLVSILYLITELLRYYIAHKKGRSVKKGRIAGAIMTAVYIGFSLFINMFRVHKLIETTLNVPVALTGISVAVSLLITVICAVCIKDRSEKKEYIGKLAAVFFGAFFLIFAVPLLMLEHTNYVLDPSSGEQIICTVTEKYTTHKAKSGTSYYLILDANGEELHWDSDKITYLEYSEGDQMELYKHKGAFGYPYYEYYLSSIYLYNQQSE